MDNLTDLVREWFNADHIRVCDGTIQVYWHRDSRGIWVPADGGPMCGDFAKRRVSRLVERIEENRDMLPMEIMDHPIVSGEMSPDGKFTPSNGE
tara:strand:- start:5918 stop:6199 length:282 start_codon:yes stop_codon:yes gene_type:complete